MSSTSVQVSEPIISEDEFGSGEFEDLIVEVKRIMEHFAPEVEFGVSGVEEGKKIKITFTFEDDSKVGLFLGQNMVRLKTLFHYIDEQQVYPHNKHVRVFLDKGPDGTQEFADRSFLDRFKRRYQEDSDES